MNEFSKSYQELCALVDRMRTNRQKVPPADLKTRYRKSYKQLKDDITAKGSFVFNCLVVMPLRVEEADMDSCKASLDDMYKAVMVNGLSEKLGDALAVYCDVELLSLYALQVQHEFERRFYMDYWLRHTKQTGSAYYNDIIAMWYDPDAKCWIGKEGEFAFYWPPTKELYEEHLENDARYVTEEIAKRTSADKIVMYA